jgi:transcriptional regulator with XRE-family HTH domain
MAVLRRMRDEAGVSQTAFQAQLGYSRGYLSRIESDKEVPSAELIRLYAELAAGKPLEALRRRPRISTRRQADAAIIDAQEVVLRLSEEGILERVEVQLHLRAGSIPVERQSISCLVTGDGGDWQLQCLEGGNLREFQQESVLEHQVEFLKPILPEEEHFVRLLIESPPSTTRHIVQRLADHDVRQLFYRLWVPPNLLGRCKVSAIPGLQEEPTTVEDDRLQQLWPTTNGLYRFKFVRLQPKLLYGLTWKIVR